MSIFKTNLLIFTLGLSLVAGHVQAGLFSCNSEIEAIKNSPEYKYGKYVVNAGKFIANKVCGFAGADLTKRVALVAHAIKTGAIKFDASYKANLAKYLTKYQYSAGILMVSGAVAISLLAIVVVKNTLEARKQQKAQRYYYYEHKR